ncbi:MAG: site-specific integrase [Gammaproteobacteria bacterium]
MMGKAEWDGYHLWRVKRVEPKAQKDGTLKTKDVSGNPIRHERNLYRAILRYQLEKRCVRIDQIPQGKIPRAKARREAFAPDEYRALHTFARTKWIKQASDENSKWYRTVLYNFILVMANTGMRPVEAKNLRWQDIDLRKDAASGREFVIINVRGKGKHRELIAAPSVAEYFERIREIAKAKAPADPVFHAISGKSEITLYAQLLRELLRAADLLKGPLGTDRVTYSFRHTYATFRLMEGVDVYFLAKQMGTSVRMIEDHYGHITPSKNAELILQGVPGWTPIAPASDLAKGSVNAAPAHSNTKPKPRGRKH